MFLHQHPYEPFLFDEATKLIVGTLPPPRFTQRRLKPGDVDFCYGSRDGQLWRILDRIFGLNLHFETTENAVHQRKEFLKSHRIGICDIVDRAEREKIDASDLGMKNIVTRDMLGYLGRYTNVETLIFTGGNSKNGPEYLFRKLLRREGIPYDVVASEVPRIHAFSLAEAGSDGRRITTVSLTAPSGSANRAVGALDEYKIRKNKDPSYTTLDFRVDQYRRFFI